MFEDKGLPLDQLQHHQFIGEYQFTISNLMCSSEQQLTVNLANGRNSGKLIIRGEAVTNTRDCLIVSLSAQNLSNVSGWFTRSSPFYVISRYFYYTQARCTFYCMFIEFVKMELG